MARKPSREPYLGLTPAESAYATSRVVVLPVPYGGTVTYNYDFGRSELLNQRYAVFYNAQCCGISFEYQSINYPTGDPRFPLPKDRRFNISFTLAGVGSFSNLLGAFGGGTY